jgi:hypothetical protein
VIVNKNTSLHGCLLIWFPSLPQNTRKYGQFRFQSLIDIVAIHYPKGDEIKEQKLPDLIGDRVLRNLVLESIYDEKEKTMS